MSGLATGIDAGVVRDRFPALSRTGGDGRPVLFADTPGGTQVPQSVIDAMAGYLRSSNANTGGAFPTSVETDAVILGARHAGADLLNCDPHEVVFGPNMTTLAFAVSRSIARRLLPGDEVVVTGLDHDANVAPWLLAAEESGARVRWAGIRTGDATLDVDSLVEVLGERTRVVAFTLASNAVGSITPADEIVRAVRERAPSALVVADAVHFAQHRLVDVRALGADLLFCSPYKVFGPHLGIMWGRLEVIEGLRPAKVRPADEHGPGRWETGTRSHEALAGFVAAVDYLAWLGAEFGDEAVGSAAGVRSARRAAIVAGMGAVLVHEGDLSRRFLLGLTGSSHVRLFGIPDVDGVADRTPTFALRVGQEHPAATAATLADRGIFVWDGDYYAVEVMRRLGLDGSGGAVRVGFCHYATLDEVDRVVEALASLTATLPMR
jgi:cysteine desulfurase family protein (TIGR01976 family)